MGAAEDSTDLSILETCTTSTRECMEDMEEDKEDMEEDKETEEDMALEVEVEVEVEVACTPQSTARVFLSSLCLRHSTRCTGLRARASIPRQSTRMRLSLGRME